MVLRDRRARQDRARLLDRVGRHRDERHHAAARMRLALFAGLGAPEPMADAYPALGTLAPKRSEMPSSGWMRRVIAFGSSSDAASRPKVRCGGFLNATRISVARFGSRLPARM